MADEPVPGDVRDFILRHIDLVAQLEALLLLRANPGERWDVARTAQRLYTSEQDIAGVLAHLCEDGLLSAAEGVYRYDCATAAALPSALASRASTITVAMLAAVPEKNAGR